MASGVEDFTKKCEIKQNETLGRFVVAATTIKVGETVLLELPMLVLPNAGDRRCANCHQLTTTFCGKCKLLPLCGDCETHDAGDCARLLELKAKEESLEQLQAHSDVHCALKCLLLRHHDEAQYTHQLQMEAQMAARRNTDIWRHYEKQVVEPLQTSGLLEQLKNGADNEVELIQQLLGALDVNAFEIRAPERGGAMRALYMRGSLFAHSCMPNLVTAIDDEYRIKIYANRFIAAGEILYNCYTNVLLGTEERRHNLKMGKYFDCSCARCLDPTELGTHMSSFVCSTCSCVGGYIVRQSPTGAWQCLLNPEHTLKPEFVANVLERAKEEIFHARDDIYRYELLLAKLSRIFHGNHYVMMDLKQHIAAILRQVLQNMAHRPNRKVYERKIRLCQEILLVLKVLQPGISRLKAIALYELANTQAELARKLYSEQEQSADDLLAQLQQVEVMMRESLRMLLFEPLATPEGQLVRSMLRELKELQKDMQLLLVSDSKDEN